MDLKLTLVTIGIFVAILDEGTKYIATNIIKKDVSTWIPVCSVVYGIIFGIICYFTTDASMTYNLLETIFIGASAGASATGVNQTYKQAMKRKLLNQTTDTDSDKQSHE